MLDAAGKTQQAERIAVVTAEIVKTLAVMAHNRPEALAALKSAKETVLTFPKSQHENLAEDD